MKKVLFTSHAASHGGAELFLLDVLREANDTRPWNCLFFDDGPIVDDLRAAGVDATVARASKAALGLKRNSGPLQILGAVKAIAELVWYLRRIFKRYDVVVANSQKALFIAGAAAFLARRPFVWILHDIITDESFTRLNRRAIVLMTRWFVDVVALNSMATRAAFIACGGDPDKTAIVYNGFGVGPSAQEKLARDDRRKTLWKEIALDPDVATVGMFGRLATWKGHSVFLRALADLDGVQALIVGDASYSNLLYSQSLVVEAEALGLTERVKFLGYREDVAELMGDVDIVVHASTSPEPFGRVVAEALLCGTPVIATTGGGVEEILTDGLDGRLVPPNQPEALREAIQATLQEPVRSRQMAEIGRKRVIERFGIDRTIAQLDDVLATASDLRSRPLEPGRREPERSNGRMR